MVLVACMSAEVSDSFAGCDCVGVVVHGMLESVHGGVLDNDDAVS